MSNQDPEWYNEQKTHNARTQMSAARLTTPLIVMLLTYGILHFFEVSKSPYVLGFLALLAGLIVFVLLSLILKSMSPAQVKDDPS